MKLYKTAFAIALALAGSASFADTYSGVLNLGSGSAHFGRDDAVGTFEDTYAFTLPAPGYLISVSASSTAPDANHDLDFSSLTIRDPANVTLANFMGNGGTDANESYWLPTLFLPAGAYGLVVKGINSPEQAAYSGDISIAVAAIPEPGTYMLMLAGLGVMGLIARRRKVDRHDF